MWADVMSAKELDSLVRYFSNVPYCKSAWNKTMHIASACQKKICLAYELKIIASPELLNCRFNRP